VKKVRAGGAPKAKIQKLGKEGEAALRKKDTTRKKESWVTKEIVRDSR